MKGPVEVRWQPELENVSLIVGWQEDGGKLGPGTIDYLSRHIRARTFAEIEPVPFFPLNGVAIENNVARFPASRFLAGDRKDIVIFESAQPVFERHRLLDSLLDTGEYYKIKELYTISGIAYPIAHTSPRRLLAVYNQPEFQKKLQGYGLVDMTWEGPPAINSFLLWLAQQRSIPAVSLWPEVSFYLSATEDLKAVKAALSFFNQKFALGLDFTALDSDIKDQDEKLAQLRREDPQTDKYIRTLEIGMGLNEEEQVKLAHTVTDFLAKAPYSSFKA